MDEPPTRPPHPAQIIHALSEAGRVAREMVSKAEKRGDANGALAYCLLVSMIDIVMRRAGDVRSAQTW